MTTRHKPFSGLPAWHSTSSGYLITNDRGEPATDRDMDRFFTVVEPDLDRILIEACEFERARGNRLTRDEAEHYKAAKLRIKALEQGLAA